MKGENDSIGIIPRSIKEIFSNVWNYIKTLVSGGVMTANEARNILDLNPMSGADNLVIPFTKISDNKVNGDGNKTDNNDETKD